MWVHRNTILHFVVRTINALVPKNRHKVMFASIPDYSDNARAIYEHMASLACFSKWTYVWVVGHDFVIPTQHRAIFIREPQGHFNSGYIRYLFHLFTSKYLFCTHSHFVEANPKRQVSVCTWHGTMLKRICAMNEREKNGPKKDQYRYFISPSKYYNDIFCKSFLCRSKDVLTCGYPRNDALFQPTDILNSLGLNSRSWKKLIVYMPTFRRPVGGEYVDSTEMNQSYIDLSNDTTVERLSTYCHNRGVLFVVKWHPSDVRRYIKINAPNIVSISSAQMNILGLQVYHLLHYADALITDYSSVFCDYMMLDRPIAFDIADIGSYSQKRGFVFDKPLDYMPGYILASEQDVFVFIDDVANSMDRSAERRHRLYNVYNDYSDACSTARVVDSTIKK